MRHSFLVALSFANICYLRIWAEVLTYRPSDTYLMVTPPRPVEYLALVAADDPRRAGLATLTGSFERTWYGGRRAGENDFVQAEKLADGLISGSDVAEGGGR